MDALREGLAHAHLLTGHVLLFSHFVYPAQVERTSPGEKSTWLANSLDSGHPHCQCKETRAYVCKKSRFWITALRLCQCGWQILGTGMALSSVRCNTIQLRRRCFGQHNKVDLQPTFFSVEHSMPKNAVHCNFHFNSSNRQMQRKQMNEVLIW